MAIRLEAERADGRQIHAQWLNWVRSRLEGNGRFWRKADMRLGGGVS
jgi:hypothetical protein